MQRGTVMAINRCESSSPFLGTCLSARPYAGSFRVLSPFSPLPHELGALRVSMWQEEKLRQRELKELSRVSQPVALILEFMVELVLEFKGSASRVPVPHHFIQLLFYCL